MKYQLTKTRGLFAVLVASILPGGCESVEKKNEPPTPPYTQEEAIELWASAIMAIDGKLACSLAMPRLEKDFIHEANARKLTNSKLCPEAFETVYRDRKELGMTLEVREITLIEEKENRAYYEVAWRESEEGDGMGVELVKTSNGWLVKR